MHVRFSWFVVLVAGLLAQAAPVRAQTLLKAPTDEEATPALVEQRWGYMGRSELVIAPRFEVAGPFSDGLAGVKLDGKYGFIDSSGEFVIEPAYFWADSFADGLAPVQRDRGTSFQYIDRDGQGVLEVQADRVGQFSEGLAWIARDRQFGFIDREGEMRIELRYQLALPFSEGLAAVKFEDRFGYVNPEGELVIDHRFEFAGPFSQGLAVIRFEGKYGYIDTRGVRVVEPRYASALPFNRGIAAVQSDNKFAFIDRNGQAIETLSYDALFSYDDRTIEGRVGDSEVITVKVGQHYETMAREGQWFQRVEFRSVPDGAEIYCPTLWDFERAPSIEALLTPENRISDGNTNVKTLMNKHQEYRAIFVKDNRKTMRRCVPFIHHVIEARF